jgi:mitogen-activated protein kinase kinase kinase
MAMLASKTPYAASLASSAIQQSSMQSTASPAGRNLVTMTSQNQQFSSPTESEFSDSIDDPDSARNWDDERVCDWLHTVNCGAYEKLFRKNHIDGENLLEMDKAVLQEMGIEKIGDRVRLFIAIKKLRTRAYANQKKRNRVCLFDIFN